MAGELLRGTTTVFHKFIKEEMFQKMINLIYLLASFAP